MKYTSQTIKRYKGRLIQLTYKSKINQINVLTGEITASTRHSILFSINKNSHEIPLKYDSIYRISELK